MGGGETELASSFTEANRIAERLLQSNRGTVDPHISQPQLSNLFDYSNALLMKFIEFLVHFKWK